MALFYAPHQPHGQPMLPHRFYNEFTLILISFKHGYEFQGIVADGEDGSHWVIVDDKG